MTKFFLRTISHTLNILSHAILRLAGRENVSFFLTDQSAFEEDFVQHELFRKPE